MRFADRSVLAVLYGVTLSGVLVVSGLANLIPIGRGRTPDWVSKCSWIAVAVAGVLACWLIIRTTADIHALEVALR